MTTELDRLLEIELLIYRIKHKLSFPILNTSRIDTEKRLEELKSEKESLKSQIESKLAQADERYTEIGTVLGRNAIRFRGQYGRNYFGLACPVEDIDSLIKELEELSQLRPIVQALNEKLKDLRAFVEYCKKDGIANGSITAFPENVISVLESILASSEVKQ